MKQSEALDLLKLGHNVFLTGPAGSGKTYLLNQYISYLRNHKVGIAVTASTGIAATHLNGRTIHSWSGMGIRDALSPVDLKAMQRDKRLRKSFLQSKVLVIDEVSMLHPYQLELVNTIAKHMLDPLLPFGGLQVILSGDFFQLPPVSRGSAITKQFAYEADAWISGGFVTCYLSEQHRQGNDPLITVLNDIRSGSAGEQTKVPLRTRYKQEPEGSVRPAQLYARNVNVDSINYRELDALDGNEESFQMESTGVRTLVDSLKRNCPAPDELRLKVGARVMFVKNDSEGLYVNGTLGVVLSFDKEDGLPRVRTFEGQVIVVEPAQWSYEENEVVTAKISQVPLKLAWAITVHKSQGMTLDAAEIDLSDAFEPGMGYVALSRVRSLSGLKLLGLNEMALTVHPKILAQDLVFQQWSDSAAGSLHEKPQQQKIKLQNEVLLQRFNGKRRGTMESANSAKSKPATTGVVTGKSGGPWTKDEDKELLIIYAQQVPIAELVAVFHRSPGAIRSRLKKLKANLDRQSHVKIDSLNTKKLLVPTIEATRDLVKKRVPLGQIAKQRKLSTGTIINHLEKLNILGELPDIRYLAQAIDGLDEDSIDEVQTALRNSPGGKLAPVYQQFQGKFSYDELRLIRLLVVL